MKTGVLVLVCLGSLAVVAAYSNSTTNADNGTAPAELIAEGGGGASPAPATAADASNATSAEVVAPPPAAAPAAAAVVTVVGAAPSAAEDPKVAGDALAAEATAEALKNAGVAGSSIPAPTTVATEPTTPKLKPLEPVPVVTKASETGFTKPADALPAFERIETPEAPKSGEIYSKSRDTPDTATSLSGDDDDIDSSVRQRIEMDSKRVGKIAENLVGVQGDINRVEKEVLGKVFDMSTMKSFLNQHEAAIKDHEKLDKEQEDLNNQANSLSKQLDGAISESEAQDKKHRKKMALLSSETAEDKAVIQGLQKELVPLVEMQKEVEKMPPVNANLTAENTDAVGAAQAATEELVFEKSKMKSYQTTTKNLMTELVKQHNYATKCHERLHQINTQLHEVNSKDARMKYEQGRDAAKGEAMEKFLVEKNTKIADRLKKAKTNLQTIMFAKSNSKGKIGSLQTEGQIRLEKLKADLGKLRGQSAQIETAMMAKITNRKLIEKVLRGDSVKVEGMQEKLLAGRLDKLQRNNSQMTGDLAQIREGLQKAQIATAKAEAEGSQLLMRAAQMKESAVRKIQETQQVARKALVQVNAAREDDDAKSQEAEEATMQAQASMLVKCGALWTKEHPNVNKKIKACVQVKQDLNSVKASVAMLTSSVEMAQGPPKPKKR